MKTRSDGPHLTPATEEALRRGVSRERLVRQIQRGQVPGRRVDGAWYVLSEEGGSRSRPSRRAVAKPASAVPSRFSTRPDHLPAA